MALAPLRPRCRSRDEFDLYVHVVGQVSAEEFVSEMSFQQYASY